MTLPNDNQQRILDAFARAERLGHDLPTDSQLRDRLGLTYHQLKYALERLHDQKLLPSRAANGPGRCRDRRPTTLKKSVRTQQNSYLSNRSPLIMTIQRRFSEGIRHTHCQYIREEPNGTDDCKCMAEVVKGTAYCAEHLERCYHGHSNGEGTFSRG